MTSKILWVAGLAMLAMMPPGRAGGLSDTTKVIPMLGVRLHKGFVIIHSRDLAPVRSSYPAGVEIDWAWHKISARAWESCLCYPKLGIAATFWDYDQPDILGYGVTGMFYLEPVFGARRQLSFSVRAAFGVSYQSRPYDEQSNPYNLSYSTYLAFPLQLGANVHLRLRRRWTLDLTTVYNHFSNGGIREPNKGINWPTAALGLAHYLDRPVFEARAKSDWRPEGTPKIRIDLTFFAAFNEPESKLYVLSPGIELKYSRRVSRLSALTAGVEAMYDNGARYEIRQAGREEGPQKGGLAVGHEFLLGRFVFSQQFGAYLFRPYRMGDAVYQRYNLVFRASDHLSVGIGLKAHRHVANFLDFRTGLSI